MAVAYAILGDVPNLLIREGKAVSFSNAGQKRRATGSPEGGETRAVEVEVVRCPHCQGSEVVKYGTASNGKERYRCQQDAACGRTFIRTYAYPGCVPEVKQQMVEMTLNGSGIRDIARVLQVGPTTVIKELKKKRARSPR